VNRFVFVKKHQEADGLLSKLASSFCGCGYSLIELGGVELTVYCSNIYLYKNQLIIKNEIIYGAVSEN